MNITDEHLNWLKDAERLSEPLAVSDYTELCKVPKYQMKGLLARLAAAERYLEAHRVGRSPAILDDLHEEWRKTAGK